MKLELDDRPYRPGDTITGHVELGPKDISLSKSQLILEGRAKTKSSEETGSTRSTYRGRAPLLYQSQPIDLKSAVPYESGSHRVPFSVRIPSTVPTLDSVPSKRGAYWTYNWGKPKENFEPKAGHALPPSFKAGPSGTSTISECYIEYNLGVYASGAAGDKRPLTIHSDCPISIEDSRSRKMHKVVERMQIQTAKLLPEMPEIPEIVSRQKSRMSIKEKVKEVTTHVKLPEAEFVVALHVPSYLHVGEKMKMKLRMEHSEPRDVSSRRSSMSSVRSKRPQLPCPDVQVESIEIKVKQTTHVRTRGALSTHLDQLKGPTWTDTQATYWKDLPRMAGEAPPLPSSDDSSSIDEPRDKVRVYRQSSSPSYQTFQLSSRTRVPATMTPSFSTYNISQVYNMRVTVSFSCAGEKKYLNYNAPIPIHPPPVHSRPSSSKSAPVSTDPFSDNDELFERATIGAAVTDDAVHPGIAGLTLAPTQGSTRAERIDSAYATLGGSSDVERCAVRA